MPRKLRLEYAGAIYHVMSRGDCRVDIFLNGLDRQDFVETLAESCQYHSEELRRETAEAEHIIREELVRLGWQ